MSNDLHKDLFKALQKAEEAFSTSVSKDGWDADLEYSFSVRILDIDDRTTGRITLDNVEKPERRRSHDAN
jgi:hypothetical protein